MRMNDWTILFGSTVIILMPLLLFITGKVNTDYIQYHEQRNAEVLPEFYRNKHFTVNFEKFFSDHLGFREYFLKSLSCVKSTLGSPLKTTNNVVIGKKGWFYFRSSINVYQGFGIPNHKDIDDFAKKLSHFQKWCKEHGTILYISIIPNKTFIYPEYLPDWVKGKNEANMLYEEINVSMVNHGVNYIDLKSIFMQKKKSHLLYYYQDQHWNRVGAFYAFEEITNNIYKLLFIQDNWEKLPILIVEDNNGSFSLAGVNYSTISSLQIVPYIDQSIIDSKIVAKKNNLSVIWLKDSFGGYAREIMEQYFLTID